MRVVFAARFPDHERGGGSVLRLRRSGLVLPSPEHLACGVRASASAVAPRGSRAADALEALRRNLRAPRGGPTGVRQRPLRVDAWSARRWLASSGCPPPPAVTRSRTPSVFFGGVAPPKLGAGQEIARSFSPTMAMITTRIGRRPETEPCPHLAVACEVLQTRCVLRVAALCPSEA